MPINYEKCIRYKDTWAAPGSALHAALTDGDEKKAKSIYDDCERVYNSLAQKGRIHPAVIGPVSQADIDFLANWLSNGFEAREDGRC